MKKNYFLLGLIMVLSFSSCNDEIVDDYAQNSAPQAGLINKSAEVDGARYTLRNVAVNPDAISLNAQNSTLITVVDDIYELQLDANQIQNLSAGKVLYIQNPDTTYLRTVNNVLSVNGDVVKVETRQAGITELFRGGELEMSFDLQQTPKDKLKHGSYVLRSEEKEYGFGFDIFNNFKEYGNENFTVAANTRVHASLNVKIGFGEKDGKLPNEVLVYVQADIDMNPFIKFSGAFNGESEIEFTDYIPASIIEEIEAYETEIEIPLGDFGSTPVKVKINDIKLPMTIIANISQGTEFGFNAGGTMKFGYAYYNNVPNKTSHIIFENTISATLNPNIKLNGEVITDTRAVVTPKVSLINFDIFDISGTVTMGVKTETIGAPDPVTEEQVTGSKGTYYSDGLFKVKSLGISLFDVPVMQDSKELWSFGTLNKTLSLSNLRLVRPSKIPCALRSYNFEFTLDYAYAIAGKKMPSKLNISYDVYDDSHGLLKAGESVTVAPYVTDTSCAFNLCIPFKIDAFGFTSGFTKRTGYIKNIRIEDELGYVAAGIKNAKGEIRGQIELGSPYNNNFWK